MVKNIALADRAYEVLAMHKRPDESFSEEVMRLVGNKGHILDLAGSWKLEPSESADVKRRIRSLRNITTKHVLKKVIR